MPLLRRILAESIGLAGGALIGVGLVLAVPVFWQDIRGQPKSLHVNEMSIVVGSVETRYRGTVNYIIARHPGQETNPLTEKILSQAIVDVENYMGSKFPSKAVVVRFDDSRLSDRPDRVFQLAGSYSMPQLPGADTLVSLSSSLSANLAWVDILPEIEDDTSKLEPVIVHEIAHYYWHHQPGVHQSTIDEAAAEFLEYRFSDQDGSYSRRFNVVCNILRDSIERKRDRIRMAQYDEACNRYSGATFLMDAEEILGPRKFRMGFRELWQISRSRRGADERAFYSAFREYADAAQREQLRELLSELSPHFER